MTYPWKGAARPMPAAAFDVAAEALNCTALELRAIWAVESAGNGFRRDGSLERRFEPHKMPGSSLNWRDSMKIKTAAREAMFIEAYKEHPEAALRATSWAGPQIMGFNHEAAGFPSALEMVRSMADDEAAHLAAFVTLCKSWNLSSVIRSHDWDRFETIYNGGGQNGAYARKIEAEFRRLSGVASPVVLRLHSKGDAVRRLQEALGIAADGSFGPETEAAVRRFQLDNDLTIDGVVGFRTWEALEARREAKPKVRETTLDRVGKVVVDYGTKASAGGAGALAAREAIERAPDGAVDLAFYGGVGLALLAATALLVAFILTWLRDSAR